jgi:hypothetical protein
MTLNITEGWCPYSLPQGLIVCDHEIHEVTLPISLLALDCRRYAAHRVCELQLIALQLDTLREQEELNQVHAAMLDVERWLHTGEGLCFDDPLFLARQVLVPHCVRSSDIRQYAEALIAEAKRVEETQGLSRVGEPRFVPDADYPRLILHKSMLYLGRSRTDVDIRALSEVHFRNALAQYI